MNNNILLWLWLKVAVSDRNLEAYKLYEQFRSIEKIYDLTIDEIAPLEFLSIKSKESILNKDTRVAQSILHTCESNKIDIITVDDERYPKQLLEIYNYPCVLFSYGDFEKAFSKPIITIVGTRKCTSYGTRIAAKISAVLSYAGFTVVTGVANGIDTAVINAVTDIEGSLLAVLPKGIAQVNLGSSYKFKDVRKNGAIITEYLPGFKSHQFVYQERNRILAGLCVGSVIIQAHKKSGAGMTANYALNQNRDVFVLPGNIDMPQSEGTNRLIKEGAIPIVTLRDIVDYYKPIYGDIINDDIPDHMITFPSFLQFQQENEKEEETYDFKRVVTKHLDEYERAVFELIQSGLTNGDHIIEKSNISSSDAMYALSSLEGKGLITAYPGNNYKIKM